MPYAKVRGKDKQSKARPVATLPPPKPGKSPQDLTTALLAWFDAHGRSGLAWRDRPCGERDPYRVWLAEVMLQQTTVAAVTPYFKRFLQLWPTVKALAEAQDDDVMRAWAGLGYYARARNMIACARHVAFERQGVFPRDEADLLDLPGVGPYTAAAIAAIAYNAPAVAVDGNVIRTLSRLYAIEDVMPANKGVVAIKARAMLPALSTLSMGCHGRSGDFTEALMDLGAQVCRPKNPNCAACPWQGDCLASAKGEAAAYPRKVAKNPKPTRSGWAFWVERKDGRVLVEKRPDTGLLGGMAGFPTSAWAVGDDAAQTQDHAEREAQHNWKGAVCDVLPGQIEHTFTHFHLVLRVVRVRPVRAPKGRWLAHDDLADAGLPTVMNKVARHVLGAMD